MRMFYVDDGLLFHTDKYLESIMGNSKRSEIAIIENEGYKNTVSRFENMYLKSEFLYAVITNCHFLLASKYTWNPDLKKHDIWIYKNGKFVPIQDLTDRELKESHNIPKMYENGAFDGIDNNFESDLENRVEALEKDLFEIKTALAEYLSGELNRIEKEIKELSVTPEKNPNGAYKVISDGMGGVSYKCNICGELMTIKTQLVCGNCGNQALK